MSEMGAERDRGEGNAPTRSVVGNILLAVAPVLVVVGAFVLAPSVGRGAGAGHGPGGQPAPREHFERMAQAMLKVVDATDAQRTQVEAIVARASDAMDTVAARHRANHDAWVAALSGPTVDRATLESLRQDELSLAAQASQSMVVALADAADALTPEQRVKLVEVERLFHPEER